jgi:hypothetical protein
MTPLAGLSGLPISGNFLGAVQLAPEGLQLSSPGVLSVNMPTSVPIADLFAYGYQGSGSQFGFVPILSNVGATSTTSFDIPVWHFSGGGGGTGNAGDASSIPSDPNAAGNYYSSLVTSALNGLESLPPQDPEILSRIELIMRDWFDRWVWGLVSLADTPLEIQRAVSEFYRWLSVVQQLGEWADFYPDAFDRVDSKLKSIIEQRLLELENACATTTATVPPEVTYIKPCVNGRQLLNEVRPWYELSSLLNNIGFSTNAYRLDEFCHGIAKALASFATIGPKGALMAPDLHR